MELLTIAEAARIARVCQRSICHLMNSGALKAIKIGRRSLIRRADLDAFLAGAPAYPVRTAA